MEHMLLALKRSADREAALETLLTQQQDRSSSCYHQWLTPEQFGPSDQDIQKITAWLQSQGFQVNDVSKGRGIACRQLSERSCLFIRAHHRGPSLHPVTELLSKSDSSCPTG
jgi:hypothetical protein